MKKWITILILALSFTAEIANAAVQTIKVEVNGMVCAFCAQGIDKKMRALPQAKDVYVNLKNKIVAIELKDGQTLPENTIKEIVKDAGYDVTNIQTIDQTVDQIKASMGKN